MKPIAATYLLTVLAIIALSIVALVLLTQNNTFPEPNPTAAPTPTTQPTSSPNTNATYKYPLTFTYGHHSEYLINNQTEIEYTIITAYHKNTTISINYSDFYLALSVQSGINTKNIGTVAPQNNGTLTLDPSDTNESFELTFRIPTYSFNGVEQVATRYELYYNGEAKLLS